ncbi:MAG: MinD/ParA family ATP-binding protein, partial [Vicinamibacteria bacterium]
GKRVLTIDWDLEAPGLHRYFHPFLEDKDLTSSPGVIEFMWDLSTESRLAHERSFGTKGESWFTENVSLLRYARSLDWDFPGEGTIDFVPAGQQDHAYAERVTTFDWRGFYQDLGGGVVFEALKRKLREDYDYVLIDSRTGISDSAGICTVQLPDDLVVMFTLNRQSILGASAAATSAFEQRRKPTGEPGLRVWPVPTRVDLAEKERLDAAEALWRSAFQRFLMRLDKKTRESYAGSIRVFYQPYFAYEEVLATFAERKHQTASLLMSMETLVGHVTEGDVQGLFEIPDGLRKEGLKRFSSVLSSQSSPRVFVLAGASDEPLFHDVEDAIRGAGGVTSMSVDPWGPSTEAELARSDALILLIDPSWEQRPSPVMEQVVEIAVNRGIDVIPILVGGLG